MKRRGNELYHLRPRDGNIITQISKHKIPPVDYILLFEGELDHTPEVGQLKIPKVWWFYDSMLILQQQVNWAMQTRADLVFVRDRRDLWKFSKTLQAKCSWLPPGIDETLWKPVETEKKYDIGFIGWVSDIRGRWLNDLAEGGRKVIAHTEAPNTWGETKFIYDKGPRLSYSDASNFYSSSRLAFHHSFTGDITWRPMEAAACKTACLSDKWDAYDQMFEPGKEIATYGDDDDMLETAEYFLTHDKEREAMAEAAYKRIIKDHTWNKRLDIIESEVKKL